MVDPSVVFIDGTHIKASANKKKFQKEQVNKAAKVYDEVLRKESKRGRAKLGKKEIEDKDDDEPPKGEKTVYTTDPDCGMFVKGEHERQFAYEAHTACERHGFGVEVTPKHPRQCCCRMPYMILFAVVSPKQKPLLWMPDTKHLGLPERFCGMDASLSFRIQEDIRKSTPLSPTNTTKL